VVGEGLQQGWVVLAQQRTQLVVRAGTLPHGVLLGPGKHRDRLGQFGIGGQWPVGGQVGAQNVGQHEGITSIGFLA
jgi:hypothetical protein